jgi:hypothetical protein
MVVEGGSISIPQYITRGLATDVQTKARCHFRRGKDPLGASHRIFARQIDQQVYELGVCPAKGGRLTEDEIGIVEKKV